MIKLSSAAGVSEFQWSATEKVWPFEKDKNGNTLYCKEVACGAGPVLGIKTVAHNITGVDATKFFDFFLYGQSGSSGSGIMVPFPYGNASDYVYKYVGAADITIGSPNGSWGGYTLVARLVYSK